MYAETSSRHQTARINPLASQPIAAGRWHDSRRLLARQRIAPALRDWLLAEGSLTQLLIEASAGDFRVQRIAQDWHRPSLSEARLLGISTSSRALVREVILWGCGEPWVYGRSILPERSLHGDLRRLRRLQNSSLGALLFRYPDLQRAPFQLARIDGNTLPETIRCDELLWGRRSRFELQQRPLIVGEVFLPALRARILQPPRGR